ncbi:hypothetical protein LguiB_021075 [Lonicera macranthoides]
MFFSLILLLRRHSFQIPHFHNKPTSTLSLFLSLPKPKPFSSLSSPNPTTTPSLDQPKPSSLSARMSFVFDQIDAIERDRSQKDETLQRIRTWRESKKNHGSVSESVNSNSSELNSNGLGSEFVNSSSSESSKSDDLGGGSVSKVVEVVHPWPEWIELMERLVHQNYFDHRRKDEDKLVEDLGFDMSEVKEEGFDFTRDWKTVQTACLNFGKDRFDILRSLSRQDIQVLVGYGCTSTDKKVVFSSKLLRKHVHLNEGDVCSSCSLRSSCERGYLLTNKEDEARTIDIMRVLLIYGFDPVNGSAVNDSLLKKKSVKTVVRKLLHEVVKLSAIPIDPNLPPPIIKKPPPKVKQPPPPPRKRVGRDDIEMKKGDWLCPKCDFMNFAKNSVCLQCDCSRPKRQLLPGEWECPGCNFLNYRRNMVCFHCEHKRPPDEFTENRMQDRQQRGPHTRLEKKIPSKAEVSNAWNFDFDDNESDGADVASFEHADSQKLDQDFPLGRRPKDENIRGIEKEYSGPVAKQPGMGFDDFDDEDDDLESYELDTRNNNQSQKTSSVDFSELEVNSESEDVDDIDNNYLHTPTRTRTNNRSSNPVRRKADSEDEIAFDTDDELPVHPNWKSSHVANSGNRARNRKAMRFDSDEETGLSSGSEDIMEDFRSRQNRGGNKRGGSTRRDIGRRGTKAFEDDDEPFSGSDSDEDLRSRRARSRGTKGAPSDRRRNAFKGHGDFDEPKDSRFKSRGIVRDGRNSFQEKFNRSSHGSRGNDRGSRGDDNYDGQRKSPRRESFGNQRGRRSSNNFDKRPARDSYFDEDKPMRPRINVR